MAASKRTPETRRRSATCPPLPSRQLSSLILVALPLLQLQSSLVVVGADTLFDAVDTDHDRSISEAEYNSAINKLLGGAASGGSAGAGMGDQHGVPPPLGLDSPSAGFRRDNGGKPAAAGGGDEKLKFHNPASTAAFLKALFASFSAIMATEIGDKTFFIAAILSMRNDRMAVFGGAILALIVMTILSTLMGLVLPSLIPRKYTHIVGGILFLYFGFRLLLDSRGMEDRVSEELEEVEEELAEINKKKNKAMKKKRVEENGDASVGADVEEQKLGDAIGDGDNGAKKRRGGGQKNLKHAPSSGMSAAGDYSGRSWEAVFLQALTMTFLAEWGDRSQIATIALAAAKDPLGVTIGGCIGHSICTGMAVLGGRMLASRISEKSVAFYGGLVFLAFGIHSAFFEE